MVDFAKQIEEKDNEIKRLSETIETLQERKTTLIAQCELDRTKIEDLEFQIEEHKLGCIANAASNTSNVTSNASATENELLPTTLTVSQKEEEGIKADSRSFRKR